MHIAGACVCKPAGCTAAAAPRPAHTLPPHYHALQIRTLQARGGGAAPGSGGSPNSKVVERVVEVEDDVDAIRERLRKEIEAKMKQDMSSEALEKAREVGVGKLIATGVGLYCT